MAVARIAGLEHVPQISASSTSPKLSNTDDFPYFFRTVAPDGPAGTLGALIQLFREFDWVRHNHADAITAALLDPSLPQHQLIAAAVLAGYADNFAHRQGLGAARPQSLLGSGQGLTPLKMMPRHGRAASSISIA